MNRRGFLFSATAAVAAMAIDPERLLWTPGERTIFVPSTVLPLSDSYVIEFLFDDGRWKSVACKHHWHNVSHAQFYDSVKDHIAYLQNIGKVRTLPDRCISGVPGNPPLGVTMDWEKVGYERGPFVWDKRSYRG